MLRRVNRGEAPSDGDWTDPMPHALIRPPSDAFAAAIVEHATGAPPDPDRALLQHAGYAEALARIGFDLVRLAPEPDQPDACFVEDQAVVRDGVAVLCRSGHPARRAEAESVGHALADFHQVIPMLAPAVLDGGDVLSLGRTLYVGLSARTTTAGAAFLAEVFGPLGWRVREVAVPGDVLHLQSVCSAVDDDTLLLAAGSLSRADFPGVARVLEVPPDEAYAANVVACGRDVLVAEGHPGAAVVLAEAGYRVHPVQMDAFQAADGALTCLSIRW